MNAAAPPVVGMVLKGYPRISETFISNEILLLEELGFRIHLFSMRKPRESFSHRSVQKIRAHVDYLPETILLHLPELLYHNFLLALKRPRPYARAMAMAMRRLARSRRLATLKHLLQAGLLVHKHLTKSGVIHFHAHFAHSPTSVALFASCLSGLPFSFTAHAKDIYTSDRRQLAEKIHLARFVVTCTDYNRKYLKGLANTGKTPIYRVYHGIDVGLFAAPPAVPIPAAPFRILTVARLTEKKGIPTILKAVRQLVDRGLEVCYTIIGDGDQRQPILGLIRTLGLTGVCRWLGTRPHHEVLEHYGKSDLFVLGCQVADNGDRDGIPNVLMESMAMGVPVVATNVSAISELITHGRTGLLVPPELPERLADAMQRLLMDAAMRAAIVPSARQLVHQAFDNQALIRSLAQIYRRHIDFEKNI